jgi:hypothetical protein
VADRQPGITAVEKPICDLVRLGMEPQKAALTRGVTEEQFEQWMHFGRVGGRGHELHVRFRRAVLQAEAECEAMLITQVRSGKNWQSAAWIAERRWPDRWLRRSIQDDDRENRPDGRPAAGGDPFAELDNVAEFKPRRPDR